ncbi:hypothetical protein U14_04392 [Candidatus Moduliflexus flocculans]|uniref:Uncharacterized protein n=1 Tax=Candidatus Moduliflexus flocculans TaxID=1499966 RepID=A0A0S6W453_9BACT|nr:hypothetical protein U14_04392 [Candidatus Moduliflexus flocculans]
MSAPTRNQFIDARCGVKNRRYAGNACEHYEIFTQECALLKAQDGQVFWKNCRAAFEVFYDTVNFCNETMRKQYDALPVDDAENLAFDDMIRRLTAQRMNIANVAAWRNYVMKMAYREIRRILVKQGLLYRKRLCGNCAHLTPAKPSICDEKGIERKKTDEPCDDYEKNIHRFESLDGGDDAEKRERIEKLYAEIANTLQERAQAMAEDTDHFYDDAMRLLRERAEREPFGSVRRKICRRQHDIFVNIFALLAEGTPKEQVEQALAKKYRLKNARTIRRDLDEIRAFLRENVRDSQ